MAEVKRTYYSTGELDSEYFEINGKINGLYKSYLKNGQLFVIKTYVDNILHGEYIHYHCAKEQIYFIHQYVNGKLNGEYKSFYENGQPQSIANYVDDKLNGECKSYRENGELYDICIRTYIP